MLAAMGCVRQYGAAGSFKYGQQSAVCSNTPRMQQEQSRACSGAVDMI